MKYVITGSLGNISKPLAQKLVASGHDVTIISSKHENAELIQAMKAKPAIGSVTDVAFLSRVFHDADAVYTMIPPFYGAPNWKKYIAGIGENFAAAIKISGVKNVVNLSSIGAHMPEGCGPVSGLYFVEKALDSLSGVNIKHLRPGFFYANFFSQIGMIKQAGIMGGNYGEGSTMILVDTNDIAEIAAEEMESLSFSGKSYRYIASDEKTTSEIAVILGSAIGKAGIPWVNFTDEDTIAGLLQAGLPEEVAKNYTELGSALRSGEMASDYLKNKPQSFGKIKLEDFANSFASVFSKT